jgi:hypothetical protein
MGSRYLRKLLVVDAHAVLYNRKGHADALRTSACKRRRLDHNQLPKIIQGVKFNNGCGVIAKPDCVQTQTAAA